MGNRFPRTRRENIQLRARRAIDDGPDLGIVEHSVPVLVQKSHVHRESFCGAKAFIAKCLLRFHKIFHSQQ